jgi:hypothetical protein
VNTRGINARHNLLVLKAAVTALLVKHSRPCRRLMPYPIDWSLPPSLDEGHLAGAGRVHRFFRHINCLVYGTFRTACDVCMEFADTKVVIRFFTERR